MNFCETSGITLQNGVKIPERKFESDADLIANIRVLMEAKPIDQLDKTTNECVLDFVRECMKECGVKPSNERLKIFYVYLENYAQGGDSGYFWWGDIHVSLNGKRPTGAFPYRLIDTIMRVLDEESVKQAAKMFDFALT